MEEIAISSRKIGAGHPALVIGEVAQAHDGSLNMAHAFIDAIADAGADAVKFQTHIKGDLGGCVFSFKFFHPILNPLYHSTYIFSDIPLIKSYYR